MLEDELQQLGLALIGKLPKKGQSLKMQDCCFHAHFGASWVVVAVLWEALMDMERELNDSQKKQ